MVDTGVEILSSNSDIREFGELLHETWMLKRDLSSEVSNPVVDDLYRRAQDAGAIGGKITGAGGGGFLLLFVQPSMQKKVREALYKRIHVPFQFESGGSQIIFYEPEREDYSDLEKDRAKRAISSFRELKSVRKAIGIKDTSVKEKSRTDTEHVA